MRGWKNMLPEKLPKLTKPGEVLTEEEWEHYFECRKKYDRYVSGEDTDKLIAKMNTLDASDPKDEKAFFETGAQIPVLPELALAIKKVQGLKELFNMNLYFAKKAYPDEF